nr:MAG TPA: hypothetical protein [Caudoviricetes sp.]
MHEKHGLPSPCVKSEECLTCRYEQENSYLFIWFGSSPRKGLGDLKNSDWLLARDFDYSSARRSHWCSYST